MTTTRPPGLSCPVAELQRWLEYHRHRMSFMNQPILRYSHEIRSAVLMMHGEKAHSCYFSRDAFQKLTGDNKELLIIPGASHVDLYDRMDVIPFEKLKRFFEEYLR